MTMVAPSRSQSEDDLAWIIQELLAGTPRRKIVDHLISIGIPEETTGFQIGSVEASLVYRACLPLLQRKRKLEALALLLGELWSVGSSAASIPELASVDEMVFREAFAANLPFIIRGAAQSWAAVRTWTFDSLSAKYGEELVEYFEGRRDVDTPEETARGARFVSFKTTLNSFAVGIRQTISTWQPATSHSRRQP